MIQELSSSLHRPPQKLSEEANSELNHEKSAHFTNRLMQWNYKMPDVFSKEKRSEVMSRIRGKGNKDTEMLLAQMLRANRVSGWRRNSPVFGKPDFIFPKAKVAVFVDGCFWHACSKHSNIPANNRDFWEKKLKLNIERDQKVVVTLRKLKWKVIRIWEHDLKREKYCISRIQRALHQTQTKKADS